MLSSFCSLLNISIHHGWLVDLEPEGVVLREAFASAAPNNLQNHAINAFKSISDQLTNYGLASLTASIKEGAFALLFRRNNLAVVCKYHGRLFELVTDTGTCNAVNGVMWKTISLSVHHEVFLASNFSSTVKQLNSEVEDMVKFIKQWKQSEEAIVKAAIDQVVASFAAEEESATPPRRSGKGNKKKQKAGAEAPPRSNVEGSVKSDGAIESGAPLPQTSSRVLSEQVRV